jgi:hypothetical protein
MIPSRADFKTWCSSLIIDFPNDNIPLFVDENEWQRFGNLLIQETSFANNAAPSTKAYTNWRDWAMCVYKVMSNF